MRKVEGADYLYQRGDHFLVRMQVPLALRRAVGRAELKKALGRDLASARHASHRIIADFQRRLSLARGEPEPNAYPETSDIAKPHIDKAVREHFRRMSREMKGKVVLADQNDPSPNSRLARVRGFQQHIEFLLDALDREDVAVMQTDASWLCEEQGWSVDAASPLFTYLCEKMLRARLACYRGEVSRLSGDFGSAKHSDAFFDQPVVAAQQPRRLGELIDKFRVEREPSWATSTRKNYLIITRVLEEVCGRETPLGLLNKDFCRGVRDTLVALPSNYQKKALTKGRPISEVIEIAKANGLPLVQPGTVNAHLNKFGAIIRFGRDEGWIAGNPMAGIEVDDPIAPQEKRDPFSIDQLNQIFSSAPWATSTYLPSGRPSRFWVPLLSLYTGARVGELCGLRIDEVVRRDGYDVFEIRHRADRKVKGGRGRIIPIHPALKRLGFLRFVEELREQNVEFLFPEERANSLDHWGDAVSDWFSRLVRRLDLQGRRLCFHSFRHSFEDALREADLHDTPLGNALTGRRTGGVSANYGSRFSTAKLAEAVARVSYTNLKLDHIHPYGCPPAPSD